MTVTFGKGTCRAVVVAGVRTPFLRAFGSFTPMDTVALGVAAVRELLRRTELKPAEIDGLVWGGVVLPSASVNIGREIILDMDLPRTIEAMTLTRACTSGLKAITQAVAAIECGEAEALIAGGSDSTSNAEVTMPPSLVHKAAPVVLSGKSGVMDYFRLMTKLSIRRDLIPKRPSVRERSTGELMGEAAERMAEINGISREAQDAFAVQSHHRAAAAIESGRLVEEICPVLTPDGKTVDRDNIVRADTTVEKMARLKPAFAENGTLTAGNSSALTDGASAVLIMREDKARALGLNPLAAFRSWSYDAVDPAGQMLIGPAISMPKALARAGMALSDVDLVDIHEAFAAQVLCVLKALNDDSFAREVLGADKACGELAPEAVNVHGGSVALGHPFAATGARMVTTMAYELAKTGRETALLGICGAGGVSAGAVMERIA